MPTTANSISPEVSRKKLVKPDPSVEPKKSIPQIFEMNTTDSATCGNQGESPTKKLNTPTKQAKKGGRRVSSAVNDTQTKKAAQKTKGSLSLNKTDQTEGDQKAKRTPQEMVQSSDPVLPQMPQTQSVTRGTGGEPRKSNVPVRIKTRTKRVPAKETKIPPAQKFAVPPATEQPGGAPTREKPQETEPPVLGKSEDVHTVSPVNNSCSFFERIQQGVKAYFGSRSSFNTGERNKKEGGIAGLSGPNPRVWALQKLKWTESCQEITEPGKNQPQKSSRETKKIKKSSAWPQNTPPTAKTMTDRSTVQFRSQEPSSAALRRMERHIEPKSNSKAEVSGMASTSSEVSRLPNEKTVKGEQKQVAKVQIPKSRGPRPGPEPPDPLSLDLLERLSRAANDEGSSYSFRHMLDEYLSSHLPSRSGSEETVSLNDLRHNFVNPEAKEKGQTSAISENPSCSNFQETENRLWSWPRVGDDISEILALCDDFPTNDIHSTCSLPPYKPFETLMHPISPSFSREFPMRYLKTPSLSLIREESPLAIENERVPKEEDPLWAEPRTHNPEGEQAQTTSEDLPSGESPLTETFKSLTNNLQIDLQENCRSLDRSSGDTQNEKEEFFEATDDKSGSTFASAVSLLSQQIPPWNLEGAPCLKGFLSLTKFSQKSCGVRKSKSESDLRALKSGVSGKAMRFPHVSEGLNDGYEKILPLDFNKALIEAKKGGKGSLLSFEVAKEVPEETSEEASEETSEDASEEASEEESPLEDRTNVANFHNRKGWSPTLPELTEIYESVLKEHKKLQRKGLLPERCSSSYMMSFLQKKLAEKRQKTDLVDFSKSFRDSFRPKYWKPGKVKDYSFGLAEYVAAFQDILQSNLSMKQITGLNNALSTFQDCHDQTHLFLTDRTTKTGKTKKKHETYEFKYGKAKYTSEEAQKINLFTPTDLETVLKKFNSEEKKMKEDKLLVTVKLSGDQVLVNSLTYFNDEDTLTPKKTKNKLTSELILENLTKSSEKPTGLSRIGKHEPFEGKMSKSHKNEESGQRKNTSPQKKEVPEFHYNQFLLRAQHPIDAIVEGTEPKPDKAEKGKLRGKQQTKEKPKSAGHNEVKRGNTLPKVMRNKLPSFNLKELFRDFSHEEVGKSIKRIGSSGSSSQPKRWFSATKKKAETVKSMFELKKSPSGKSAKPRSTYLCYPSVMSFQERTTKKIKDKSRYFAKGTVPPTTYKPKQTKNVTRPISKWEANKKPSKEPLPTSAGRQASRTGSASATTESQQKQEPVKTGESPQAPESEAPKVAECCSIELLVSDASGSALSDVTKKTPEEPPKENDLPVPVKTPPTTGAPRLARESAPILLHCSKSDADGKSFRSEIIHSDSFLKYCTPINVTHSRLRSLFKCNSDIKFYPGRVCDSSDNHEPFITFVLTPRQNETAGLPRNLVQVVQKGGTVEAVADAKEQEAKVALGDIEKFIAEMANFKRRAIQRQRQNANQKKISSVKFDTRHKTPPGPGDQSSSGTGRSPERKVYHECQKRKLAQEQANAAKRAVTPILKQKRSAAEELEGEKPDEVLDNLIRKTCQAVMSLFKKKYLEDQKAERLEKMQDKATEVSWTENRFGDFVAGITQGEWNRGQEEYENISVIPNELLQAIKLAINQVDDLEGKDKIISAIEDVEKKRSGNEVEERSASPNSVPKKSKTIRIKIRCKGHRCSEKRAEGVHGRDRDEGRQNKELALQVAEVKVQGTSASMDTEGSVLGSTNSTYFDALEKNDETGGAGEMVGDVQRISRPTVEEVPSSQFFVVDSRGPASLTPSDEMLLTTVSFEKEKEEIIYRKISKYLEEGKVSYSMTLLDVFLKKTENSLDDVDSRVRLNDLLSLVEKKSRNLLVNLEKNAWIKVLSLLEEATRVLDDESVKHSKKALLVEKIQSLNLEKLFDLEDYSNSPSSSTECMRNEEGQEGSVLRLIKESLAFLKQKVVRKGSAASRSESPTHWDEDAESSESALRIHSTNGFPEMREGPGGPNARYLKNKLRQQRVRLERLLNANGDLFSPKLGDLKNIVMMKMKSLEQYNLGECSKATCPRHRASHIALDRKRGPKGSWDSLNRSPGYVDLVRYFMKAWDARMSLSSFSNCRI